MPQEKNKQAAETAITNEELQQMQQQLNLVRQEYSEMHSLQESLSRLSEIKKDDELLISIGRGIFVNASVQNTDDVLVDVGSSVVVKKKINAARKMIEQETSQLKLYAEELEKQFNMLILRMKH